MGTRRIEVKDVFTHNNRLCVIAQMEGFANLARTFIEPVELSKQDYCNGYVQVLDKNKGKNYNAFINKVTADELTFSDTLDHLKDKRIPEGTYFFGFDSAHYWNDRQPESKTCESVKQRTIKLAEEMTGTITDKTPSLNDNKTPTGLLWKKLQPFAEKVEGEYGTVYGTDAATDEMQTIIEEAKREAYDCQTLKDFQDHRTKCTSREGVEVNEPNKKI